MFFLYFPPTPTPFSYSPPTPPPSILAFYILVLFVRHVLVIKVLVLLVLVLLLLHLIFLLTSPPPSLSILSFIFLYYLLSFMF